MSLNPSQQRAVDWFRGFMQRQLNTNPEYGDEVIEFTVKTDGILAITARTQMTKLGEGNLLRALDAQWWLVFIGKRGAITAKMAPKSFKQFNGRKAFGITFDI